MKKTDWDNMPAIESRYARGLSGLIKTVKTIVKTYNTVEGIVSALQAITDTPAWQQLAEAEARKMAYNVASSSAKNWREAAKNNVKAKRIFELLKEDMGNDRRFQELINRNAIYISNIPLDVAESITNEVAKATIAGQRAESIIVQIQAKAPQLTRNRIALIARTEVSKTQSVITKIRSERIGSNWYIWQTSQDQRVRSSHKHMQGVVCNFSNPPNPEQLAGEDQTYGYYNAGEIFNCRCYPAPIIDLNFETFPKNVIYNNKITKMTRQQFEKIY